MTVILESGPNVLFVPLQYSLEELDNYLHTWKSSGTFSSQSEAEDEMRSRVDFNPELKFRIIEITTETKLVATSEEIASADSLDDSEGNQAI